MSISNGSSDVVGGLATISCVEQKGGYVWVTVKEHPNRTHNWEMLQKEQAKLKKEFGKRKAYPDPDIDTPWIEPGDTVDGVEYIGQRFGNMLHLKTVKIGFDLGGTLVHGDSHHNGSTSQKVFYPRAIDVVRQCVELCKDAFIISKVNDKQRERALALLESSHFHEITGMPKENVFFCARRDQKGPIAEKLGINAFVDDRPEVMAYMDKKVYRILYDPILEDVIRWKVQYLPIARSWIEVSNLIFGSTPSI